MHTNLTGRLTPTERQAAVIAQFLVMGMALCAGITIQVMFERFSGTWTAGYLPVLMALGAGEALLSLRQIKRFYSSGPEGLVYRLGEFALWFVALRIFFYIRMGVVAKDWGVVTQALRRLPTNPVEILTDPEFLAGLICLILVWMWATMIGESLVRLESDRLILQSDWNITNFSDRTGELRSMAVPLFGVGILLILLTYVLQSAIMGLPGQPITQSLPRWNVLVYFLLVFVLLSQGQLAVLRAGWNWLRLPSPRNISGQWLVFGLAFVGILGLVASLLPKNLAMGPIEALATLVSYLLYFIAVLVMLIAIAFGWAMGSVMPGDEETPRELLPTFVQQTLDNPPMNETLESAPPFWETAGTVLFWVVFIALVIYTVTAYARQNEGVMRTLQRFFNADIIQRVWEFFDTLLHKTRQQVSNLVEAGRARLAERRARRERDAQGWFANPGQLPPRERVRFFYLALLRRSAQRGISRSSGQTPNEFANTLEGALPDDQPTVEEMTDAFNRARYSNLPVTDAEAETIKKDWQALNRSLRERDKKE